MRQLKLPHFLYSILYLSNCLNTYLCPLFDYERLQENIRRQGTDQQLQGNPREQ